MVMAMTSFLWLFKAVQLPMAVQLFKVLQLRTAFTSTLHRLPTRAATFKTKPQILGSASTKSPTETVMMGFFLLSKTIQSPRTAQLFTSTQLPMAFRLPARAASKSKSQLRKPALIKSAIESVITISLRLSKALQSIMALRLPT